MTMKLYTFAAFTILAITMGQTPQSHADPIPDSSVTSVGNVSGAINNVLSVRLGDGQLAPGSIVLTIRDSNHKIEGHIKSSMILTVQQIIPKPGEYLCLKVLNDIDIKKATKHNSNCIGIEEGLVGDVIAGLVNQFGGQMLLQINYLGVVINATQDVVDMNGNVIDRLTQSSVKESEIAAVVLSSSVLAMPRNYIGLAIGLELLRITLIKPALNDGLGLIIGKAQLNNVVHGSVLHTVLGGDAGNENTLSKIYIGTPAIIATDIHRKTIAVLAGGTIINVLQEIIKLSGSNISLTLASNYHDVILYDAAHNELAKISGNDGLTKVVTELEGSVVFNLYQMGVASVEEDWFVVRASDSNGTVVSNLIKVPITVIDSAANGDQNVVFSNSKVGVYLLSSLFAAESALFNVSENLIRSAANRGRVI